MCTGPPSTGNEWTRGRGSNCELVFSVPILNDSPPNHFSHRIVVRAKIREYEGQEIMGTYNYILFKRLCVKKCPYLVKILMKVSIIFLTT